MKLLSVVFGSCLVVASVFAQDVSLFNGKDLSGWEGNLELWSVKDGVIRGETQATPEKPAIKHNTFLVWKDGKAGDFELKLQYRFLSAWGNSGVQYRSEVVGQGPNGPMVKGYQADFEAGDKYSGILYEERGRGILAMRGNDVVVKVDPANPKRANVEVKGSVGDSQEIQAGIKQGDWNEYRIVAKGNHLQHFINGKQTVNVVDEFEGAAKEGVIALQLHSGPPMVVEFKDIVLKELK